MGIAYGQVFGKKHYNVQPDPQIGPTDHRPCSAAAAAGRVQPKREVKCPFAWEPWEIRLAADPTKTFDEISIETGRTRKAVMAYVRKHGFDTSKSRYLISR